jgi:hypothetical protein
LALKLKYIQYMKAHSRLLQILIFSSILTLFLSSALAGWDQQLQDFKKRQFVSRQEIKSTANDFQNKLMDDESISYAQKVHFREKMYRLENEKSASFPEPHIIGFKKVLIDTNHPNRGYALEPQYQ